MARLKKRRRPERLALKKLKDIDPKELEKAGMKIIANVSDFEHSFIEKMIEMCIRMTSNMEILKTIIYKPKKKSARPKRKARSR